MDTNATGRTSLTEAMRAIRIEEAERTGVVVALRDAEFARLAILHDRVRSVLDQVPKGIDLFDAGLVPGETPRLWVDMIAFVEMGRDKRTYRFLQDTRNGRRIMAESDDAAVVSERITAYVASRLIERERMLALPPVEPATGAPALPRADVPAELLAKAEPAGENAAATDAVATPPPAAPVARGGIHFSGIGGFVLFLLGMAAGAGGLLAVAQLVTRL